MFPPKIKEFVDNLRQRTYNGALIWKYDDNLSAVRTFNDDFGVTLKYSFNEIMEVGEFTLLYLSYAEGKEYRFYTNFNSFDSYESARLLYEAAQSSNLKLPF